MSRTRRIGWGMAVLASGVAATLVWAEAPAKEPGPARGQAPMHQGQSEPLHPDMRQRMQAHDARLDELVAAMNAASGEAKVDAIAAVVNELVEQRRTRRGHIEERWKRQQGGKGRTSP